MTQTPVYIYTDRHILLTCCGVLRCVEVCCAVLQCVSMRCSVLQCVAAWSSVLQHGPVCCAMLQRVAVELLQWGVYLSHDVFLTQND